MRFAFRRSISLGLLLPLMVGVAFSGRFGLAQDPTSEFGTVFDQHWEQLSKDYPYFELYGVDWDAERADHRPRAVAAESATEFAWEIARMLTVLRDSHTDFMPPIELLQGWAMPDVVTASIDRKIYVVGWGGDRPPIGPARYRTDPRAYPEIVRVQGAPIGSASQILAAGPLNSTLPVRLRWADGTETDEEFKLPAVTNVPPPKTHFGERWVVAGRVGSIGYLRVKTFQPKRATLNPAGKMAPILRARLKELLDTDCLILDLQGNGGGIVSASDPFLSHFLEKRASYAWGNSGGRTRRLNPRSPRCAGAVVVLVDERTGSGGEWAARILRDAGRATVVGGRTLGAEAAIHTSTAADGSALTFSRWPMTEPGVTPFQDKGVELDHALPLTIEEVRSHGYEQALARVRRARFAKALEILCWSEDALDAVLQLADESDREEGAKSSDGR